MTPNIQSARKSILTTPQMKSKKRTKSKTRSSITSEDKENNEKVYEPNSMDYELVAGVNLITRFIQKSQLRNKQSLDNFGDNLINVLKIEYTGHWYPERPEKGSAFRCLRINQNGGESLIEKTARTSGLSWIVDCLPKEFTIWIDPGEVSYRIGEEGSICVHYKQQQLVNSTNKKVTPPVKQ